MKSFFKTFFIFNLTSCSVEKKFKVGFGSMQYAMNWLQIKLLDISIIHIEFI